MVLFIPSLPIRIRTDYHRFIPDILKTKNIHFILNVYQATITMHNKEQGKGQAWKNLTEKQENVIT
jgi:hypothetical protein